MNTPTSEQLQDAAIWLSQQNYQKEQGEQEYMMYFDVDIPEMLTAYANHVLMKQKIDAIDSIQALDEEYCMISNSEVDALIENTRKLAALQEKVDYWVEH